MAPTVQKAVVIQQDGSVALREIPVPKPGPDEILVKVVAVAQNPADCACRGSSLCAFVQLNFENSFSSRQGSPHCTAGAPEQSLGATSRELSRRSGQTFRMVCARSASASPVQSTEVSHSI